MLSSWTGSGVSGAGGYISVGLLVAQVVHKGGQGHHPSPQSQGMSGKSPLGGLSQGGPLPLSLPVATAQGLGVARMLCAQGATSLSTPLLLSRVAYII